MIHDFPFSYSISVDDMAFGDPYKYVKFDLDEKEIELWDDAIFAADNKYRQEEHNIYTYNYGDITFTAIKIQRKKELYYDQCLLDVDNTKQLFILWAYSQNLSRLSDHADCIFYVKKTDDILAKHYLNNCFI